MKKIQISLLVTLLTSMIFCLFTNVTSANVRFDNYSFTLDKEFNFPDAPKNMGVFQVSEKSKVDAEWATEIAKKFGFVDDNGNPIKPTIDYYYQMPHFNPPSEREKPGKSTEQVDDEKQGDQGYELPKQPEVVWPPRGAKAKIKLFTFQKNNSFLKINENNGAIFYSNNNFMNFALPNSEFNLSDKEALDIAQKFIQNIDLPKIEWDPTNSEPLFSNVEVFQAEQKSGEILDSYTCMKEITFVRQLYDYPVVGGGSAIRMAIGLGVEAPKNQVMEYNIASFSKLTRILENPEITQLIYTPSEAYDMLKQGKGLLNDNIRFHSEGTIVINKAYLAYYDSTGYEDNEYLTPVWVFNAYDSDNPDNTMEFYINAKKEETPPPDETFVKITTDKTYYTANDSQQVSIEIYTKNAENLVLYVGYFAPDGYFYSFPFWAKSLFPVVASLPAGFHIGPFEFLNFNPISSGPYKSNGHFAYFALLMNHTTYELLCPISVAEFDIE
ncbi:hypothetical protein KKB18_08415 [bacterium]|nr:hypothetical protein [bacterium]